jgi:hypothetical protein
MLARRPSTWWSCEQTLIISVTEAEAAKTDSSVDYTAGGLSREMIISHHPRCRVALDKESAGLSWRRRVINKLVIKSVNYWHRLVKNSGLLWHAPFVKKTFREQLCISSARKPRNNHPFTKSRLSIHFANFVNISSILSSRNAWNMTKLKSPHTFRRFLSIFRVLVGTKFTKCLTLQTACHSLQMKPREESTETIQTKL